MLKTLPGATVEVDISNPQAADDILSSLFLTGGLMLSQVSQFTGLEPHTIQNWVKRGFLPPPQNKRYDRSQLCRILNIHMLKDTLALPTICRLLSYINGQLDKNSDDSIDDSQLYLYIIQVVFSLENDKLEGLPHLEERCRQVLEGYREPFAGARDRVLLVLCIIVTAHLASRLTQQANLLIGRMED